MLERLGGKKAGGDGWWKGKKKGNKGEEVGRKGMGERKEKEKMRKKEKGNPNHPKSNKNKNKNKQKTKTNNPKNIVWTFFSPRGMDVLTVNRISNGCFL